MLRDVRRLQFTTKQALNPEMSRKITWSAVKRDDKLFPSMTQELKLTAVIARKNTAMAAPEDKVDVAITQTLYMLVATELTRIAAPPFDDKLECRTAQLLLEEALTAFTRITFPAPRADTLLSTIHQ